MADLRERTPLSEIMQPSEGIGVRCQRCGCCDLRTRNVYRVKSGAIHRTRICRNCNEPLKTFEVVREKK